MAARPRCLPPRTWPGAGSRRPASCRRAGPTCAGSPTPAVWSSSGWPTPMSPTSVIERAAELLEEAAAQLDGPGRVRRYEGFAESANAGGDPEPPLRPQPDLRHGQPARPADARSRSATTAAPSSSTSSYGTAYEGPPGSVHGGVVAAMFDEVLGMTQSLSGQPGMTGTLRIRYRRPTPLHRELRFEGTLDRVDGSQDLHDRALPRRRRRHRRGRGPVHPRRLPTARRHGRVSRDGAAD